jgi:hypothetical protein
LIYCRIGVMGMKVAIDRDHRARPNGARELSSRVNSYIY